MITAIGRSNLIAFGFLGIVSVARCGFNDFAYGLFEGKSTDGTDVQLLFTREHYVKFGALGKTPILEGKVPNSEKTCFLFNGVNCPVEVEVYFNVMLHIKPLHDKDQSYNDCKTADVPHCKNVDEFWINFDDFNEMLHLNNGKVDMKKINNGTLPQLPTSQLSAPQLPAPLPAARNRPPTPTSSSAAGVKPVGRSSSRGGGSSKRTFSTASKKTEDTNPPGYKIRSSSTLNDASSPSGNKSRRDAKDKKYKNSQ